MLPHSQLYLQKELVDLNNYILELLQTEDTDVCELISYLLQQQGKQLRAQLVLNSALALGGDITPKALRGAALISLLHHASLIHDDVVDEAKYRRHKETFHRKWNNKIAVLFGDYLLATILRVAVNNQDYECLSMLVTTAQMMSLGEINHLAHIDKTVLSEVEYLKIIQHKTASLFGASCAVGALSIAATSNQVEVMYTIGEQLGMAFQLRDDLLDYIGNGQESGKAAGMDLLAEKMTLPFIYALQQTSTSRMDGMLDMFYQSSCDSHIFQNLVTVIKKAGGFDYTLKQILLYKTDALTLLKEHVLPSVHREEFCLLIENMLQL